MVIGRLILIILTKRVCYRYNVGSFNIVSCVSGWVSGLYEYLTMVDVYRFFLAYS